MQILVWVEQKYDYNVNKKNQAVQEILINTYEGR